MVSKNFTKSIVYGFAIMFLTAGLLYGFNYMLGNTAAQKDEQVYVGKLATYVNEMRKISIDEQNLVQRWNAEKVISSTAVAGFADAKVNRQQLEVDFFSRTAPKRFAQIHQQLRDANTLWMEADDMYREGTFQNKGDYILNGDAKVVTAKEKFDSALAQLEKLGYKL